MFIAYTPSWERAITDLQKAITTLDDSDFAKRVAFVTNMLDKCPRKLSELISLLGKNCVISSRHSAYILSICNKIINDLHRNGYNDSMVTDYWEYWQNLVDRSITAFLIPSNNLVIRRSDTRHLINVKFFLLLA